MKRKTALAALVVLFAGVGICMAADMNMGTWKLNEAKSKLNPLGTKNSNVVYEMAGDSIKVTVDGTDKEGKPFHSEWTGKFDGKEYPVTGDPMSDARSYKVVDAKTMDLTTKMAGKTMATGRIVVAADGKSRTLTTTATDPAGKKVTGTAVYDKQ